MKNNILYFALIFLGLSSCNFLDREPLDFGNENSYFKNANDLKIYMNDFYELEPNSKAPLIPVNNGGYGGLYTEDVQSDNQCSANASNLFYKGEKKTVKSENSGWNFSNLRGLNYFINKAEEKKAKGEIQGNEDLINHYLGEGYFFRAYDYFRLLRTFGDAPIFTKLLSDDKNELTQASVRYPRNEVARFILRNLDIADSLLMAKAPESGRITRDAALLLKARVALYEATWEKYHAGTCFVPGNNKWVGKETWPNFTFKAGSAEAEVNFFFEEAIEAAEKVADVRPLNHDYQTMFNSTTIFGDNDEVVLARYYANGVLSHSCSAFLKSGGGCGVTRAFVNTFLMKNGLPIYDANSEYKGDELSYYEFQGRDPRLTESVRAAGSLIDTKLVDGKFVNDTIFYYKPYIYNSGSEKSTTGYEVKKWFSPEVLQQVQYNCTTTVPIFRSAEAYLIYLEAYYERYKSLGGKCAKYWTELRIRAGIDSDYMKTINATDLTKENDLAIWSKGAMIDKTLYNIRRERRCEFIAEGLRLDDLKRWRSLDNMNKYQPEGMNLWTEAYKMYSSGQLDETIISQKGVSIYIRPLQIFSTSAAYDGYTFPKPHYLEPIPISEFLLTVVGDGKSTIYQNPGWPTKADGTADYGYDCD